MNYYYQVQRCFILFTLNLFQCLAFSRPFYKYRIGREVNLQSQKLPSTVIASTDSNQANQVYQTSPLVTSALATWKSYLWTDRVITTPEMIGQIKSLATVTDIMVILILNYSCSTILRGLFNFINLINRRFSKANDYDYQMSIFGRLERPLKLLSLYPVLLYQIDVVTILLTYFGFKFHKYHSLPELFSKVVYSLWLGLLAVTIKDWLLFKYRSLDHRNKELISNMTIPSDLLIQERTTNVTSIAESTSISPQAIISAVPNLQQRTVDEITSGLIWFVTSTVAFEQLAQEFGIGIRKSFVSFILFL